MTTTKNAPASLPAARPSQKNGAAESVSAASQAATVSERMSPGGSAQSGNGHAPCSVSDTIVPEKRGPKLSKAANVRLQFARTYRQLVTGEIDERKATARARILEGALAAIESTKLEARLNALEKERKAEEAET